MTCSLCKKVGHNKRSCQYTQESLKQKSIESLKKICKDRKIENYKKQSKSKLIFMITNLPNNCYICRDPLNENDRTSFLESTDQESGPCCMKSNCHVCEKSVCLSCLLSSTDKDGLAKLICSTCVSCKKCNDAVTDIKQENWINGELICDYCFPEKNIIQIYYENTPNFLKTFPLITAILPNNMRNVTFRIL